MLQRIFARQHEARCEGAMQHRRRQREEGADARVLCGSETVAPEARDVLLGLARDYPVKLALDEAVVRLEAARRWQAEGWNGIFVLKPALCGPLSEIAAWVQKTKADIVLSSAIETAVGKAAILRWALTTGVTTRALGFGTGEMFGNRAWDGPAIGPLLDGAWCDAVKPEELWNELS